MILISLYNLHKDNTMRATGSGKTKSF